MEQSPNNTYQAIALFEQIFPHLKTVLYQYTKLRFFYWEFNYFDYCYYFFQMM